jgi:hypothetical protein
MVYLKKGQLISAIAAMAAFAAVLAGCGGDESSTIGATIPVTGTARTISVYVRRTVVTVPGTAQVGDFSVTPDGPIINALVPGGYSVTVGDVVTMIETSSVLLPGLRGTSGGGAITLDSAAGTDVDTGMVLSDSGIVVAKTSPAATRGPGDGSFILPPRTKTYKIRLFGPLEVTYTGKTLSVSNSLTLYVPVTLFAGKAIAGIPIGTDGRIPANGGTAHGLSMKVTTPGYYQSYNESLTITKSNGTLRQKRVTGSSAISVDKQVTFADLTASGNSNIPANGVQTVTWKLWTGTEPGL